MRLGPNFLLYHIFSNFVKHFFENFFKNIFPKTIDIHEPLWYNRIDALKRPGRAARQAQLFIIPYSTPFCQVEKLTTFTQTFCVFCLLHFPVGSGILTLFLRERAKTKSQKDFEKNLKKLLTNLTECAIMKAQRGKGHRKKGLDTKYYEPTTLEHPLKFEKIFRKPLDKPHRVCYNESTKGEESGNRKKRVAHESTVRPLSNDPTARCSCVRYINVNQTAQAEKMSRIRRIHKPLTSLKKS